MNRRRLARSAALGLALAGLGAAGMLGLILLALGSVLAVVHRRQSAASGQAATAA